MSSQTARFILPDIFRGRTEENAIDPDNRTDDIIVSWIEELFRWLIELLHSVCSSLNFLSSRAFLEY